MANELTNEELLGELMRVLDDLSSPQNWHGANGYFALTVQFLTIRSEILRRMSRADNG